VGLGPAGHQVVRFLKEHNVKPVAIDLNPRSRDYGREAGIEVHLGDADNEEVLVHAGIDAACMAVVTLPDPHAAIRVVQLMRRLHPSLLIVVRGRYNRYIADIAEAGADKVVDEETTIGRMLGQAVTESLGESTDAALACRLGGIARNTTADNTV
jgi:voltage-gated potassium channel Kch